MSAVLLLFTTSVASGQPFTLQGPGLDASQFRVTTFASGLNFPVGMVELEDGSILTAVSNGNNFFGSTSGSLVRLQDTNGDGVADTQQTLVSNVPGGSLASLTRAGDLLAITGQGGAKPISIYRLGATPTSAPTLEGTFTLSYPGGWLHPHSSVELREKPGESGTYELYFQVGSQSNIAETTGSVSITSTLGLSSTTLVGDAVHRVELVDNGSSVTAGSHSVVATGLRNPTGLVFHPVTGDLYIGDNGIDGLQSAIEAHSPDELNALPAADLYGGAEDFGFPVTYEEYRTEVQVGSSGILPIANIQPVPSPDGAEAEGVNEIAFAPPRFPAPMANGVFMGFHGQWSSGGVANEENAVAFVDLDDGSYFHAVAPDEANIGHPDGLLSTTDTLYISDISPAGGFGSGQANEGAIYAITSLIAPGDYNYDGVVDAADYTVWRDSLGEEGIGLPADGNGDYAVTVEDYLVWRDAFAAAGDSLSAVPEPAGVGLALLAATLLGARRRTV